MGIEDLILSKGSVLLFPNPSNSLITIYLPNNPQMNATLTIYNLNSQKLITRQIAEQKVVIDVSGLPSGIYFVKVEDIGKIMTGRFVKE
jgi:hypothetical protein